MGGTQFENAMGIAVDSSSNIIVSGIFRVLPILILRQQHNLTSSGGNDIFLARYDSAGNYLWAIAIGAGEELTTQTLQLMNMATFTSVVYLIQALILIRMGKLIY
ncbi:MAG: hypothetical protein R2847_08255 [Bacteroidia bacterium]